MVPEADMGVLLEVGIVEEGYADLIGVVTGVFGRPVSNALVEIDGETPKSTLTDAFGKYEFMSIVPASWRLRVSHILYELYETTVDVIEMETNIASISLSVKIAIKISVFITGCLGLFIGGVKLAGGRK